MTDGEKIERIRAIVEDAERLAAWYDRSGSGTRSLAEQTVFDDIRRLIRYEGGGAAATPGRFGEVKGPGPEGC